MGKPLNSVIITPETHWDREWYLPFQSYRMKLVLLTDRLLEILRNKPEFANFTFDGQTVVLQDYLEVRPEKEAEMRHFIQAGRITVGPMYVLPDVYLESGESLIRNFMLGFKVARLFGQPMKAAYIPDPFGHHAQLPQIVSGFDIPGVLFGRGFGNEFEDQNLDIEFNWHAPGNAASTIGIHLIRGYGSVAGLNDERTKDGIYKSALGRCENVAKDLADHSCTGIVPLNNGSDHLFAQSFIPDMMAQWNEQHPDVPMIQADFGEYLRQIVAAEPQMQDYEGELHSARYQHLLSGVLSARIWIKQKNFEVETLLERYAEPAAALNWLLNKSEYPYPSAYLWGAWQTLIRNHPHDSICGCSIDEVHDIDMKARFYNAQIMGEEILKESLFQLSSNIPLDDLHGERVPFMIFNPLPWERSEMIRLKIFCDSLMSAGDDFKIVDEDNTEYKLELESIKVADQYTQTGCGTLELRFVGATIPACGYKIFYLYPGEPEEQPKASAITTGDNWMENQFYRVEIHPNGTFMLSDKITNQSFDNLGFIEDTGDWGDEYDFSWPKANQQDTIITSQDLQAQCTIKQGAVLAQAIIKFTLNLPKALKDDKNRSARSDEMVPNDIEVKLELPSTEAIIRLSITVNNTACDHRFRIAFPTGIQADHISADGHFYVLPRKFDKPDDSKWTQAWQPTHHENKFVCVANEASCLAVMNKGLPEYEPRKDSDGNVTFLITLLRSIGYISRSDFDSRKSDAGPSITTPGAQLLGTHSFELALTTADQDWIESPIYRTAENYVAPLQPMVPQSVQVQFRIIDAIPLFMGMMFKSYTYENDHSAPMSISVMKFNNPKITMTALKKAENDDALIVRVLNLADDAQTDKIEFCMPVQEATIVNLNEEVAVNPIKAEVSVVENIVDIALEPHVLATLKMKF